MTKSLLILSYFLALLFTIAHVHILQNLRDFFFNPIFVLSGRNQISQGLEGFLLPMFTLGYSHYVKGISTVEISYRKSYNYSRHEHAAFFATLDPKDAPVWFLI